MIMKKLDRRLGLVTALLLALLFVACGPAEAPPAPDPLPEVVEMFFIYEELCASCDGTEAFYRIVREQLGGGISETHPYAIITINTFNSGGQQRFEELSYNLLAMDASALRLPVLIVNGQALQGLDEIAAGLREAYLTAGDDLFVHQRIFNPRYQRTGDELFADFPINPDSLTLVYFYRLVCFACTEIEPLIDGLPETVEIDGRQAAVDVIKINIRSGNNIDRVLAFFDTYQVPDEDRMVPIIFTASGYYAGPEDITEAILSGGLWDECNLGFRFP
ncbi:MAG: hypothetical protein FWD03_00905 [Defluviitaleaceae bacterium]|nr:hypothetical protein [Defluviitaleaceae bacterium]